MALVNIQDSIVQRSYKYSFITKSNAVYLFDYLVGEYIAGSIDLFESNHIYICDLWVNYIIQLTTLL